MEGGNTLEDTLEYLEYIQDEVDIFDVSCGLNGSIPVSYTHLDVYKRQIDDIHTCFYCF